MEPVRFSSATRRPRFVRRATGTTRHRIVAFLVSVSATLLSNSTRSARPKTSSGNRLRVAEESLLPSGQAGRRAGATPATRHRLSQWWRLGRVSFFLHNFSVFRREVVMKETNGRCHKTAHRDLERLTKPARPHPARPGGESDWPASPVPFATHPRSRRRYRGRGTACRDRNCRNSVSKFSAVSPKPNPISRRNDRNAFRSTRGVVGHHSKQLSKWLTRSFGLDMPYLVLDIVFSTEDCYEKGRV